MLDKKYAEEGIHVHQRPLNAAIELLGTSFSLGIISNPEVQRIVDAYTTMIPEVETSWPGAGIGLIASMDQVRKTTFPILYGENNLEIWKIAGFSSDEEWWNGVEKNELLLQKFLLLLLIFMISLWG
ncbi:hypothetical protein [Enterobacter ludwigii]|uniref:hypothetical protein n=1 Tax=Enterobacter ludwigii TaxID=299767 RepID=UPI001E5E51C0|nr:hypothetical protein [Enterobacter ludwigii]MCE1918775.1 hypothetical protein [Enterobacter ludwigii]